MIPLSSQILAKLLEREEKARAGVRSAPVALTNKDLADYRNGRVLLQAVQFEHDLTVLQQADVIAMERDRGGLICRITVRDYVALAAALGLPTRSALLDEATSVLGPFLAAHPVIGAVLARWRGLGKVRGTDVGDVLDWQSACLALTEVQLAGDVLRDVPIRALSTKLYKDSKRLERLAPLLDVLLQGDVDAEARYPDLVWQELGLIRDAQPARLAGRVTVRRLRNSGVLDSPYGAFDPESVRELVDVPSGVLTIENQANFHAAARAGADEPVLLMYTAGMPGPAWLAMYERLLGSIPVGVPIRHWGDVDEGGFRIASYLAAAAERAGHCLEPELMHPDQVPEEMRRPASAGTLARMAKYAEMVGWFAIAQRVQSAGFTMEQEAMLWRSDETMSSVAAA
ncbi:Wadjet anti-phage system protein JetD domain-containing protein [Jeongeupia sp. USM3]|uniref:Wadjet anti-phage system protein JetD domain-containing protein n=1 Tax=Jeongeupia sp. USM3 TaxID=1906741 RepID=UPI00089E0A6D|nr:Wadjet anti-phage system protein JetD domain-containing protein [Jeongeupia sp. USM3]AOY00909.1 hypothetical protein BJP62_10940 [Jeongeupia sp. USM3]